jgi:hypothetical protein
LVGNPKSKHPLDIPEGEQENMRRVAHRIAELEQKRIALTDEEVALFEAYIYENIRRQYTGERAIQHPDFWHARNDALSRKQRGLGPRPTAERKPESVSAAAELRLENRPAEPAKPAGQQAKPAQTNTREQFFNEKVAAAQGYLDEMRRLLEALGQRLDAAKIDEEVDFDSEVDEIEGLIWRYNDALESARDAWLRDNLSGAANTRLSEMLTPLSLGLPMFTDDQQAQRAWRQATQIGDRLRARDATMDRIVFGMRATEIAGNMAGVATGGLLIKATIKAGKWAVVKTVVGIGMGIAAEQGVEAGLRAAGASEQKIRGARLAVVVVAFILLRRRSGSAAPESKTPNSIGESSATAPSKPVQWDATHPLIEGMVEKPRSPANRFLQQAVAEETQATGAYTRVGVSRPLSEFSGLKITPDIRPDVMGLTTEGRIDMIEIMSPSQSRWRLEKKLGDALEQLPSNMRGGIRVIDPKDAIK